MRDLLKANIVEANVVLRIRILTSIRTFIGSVRTVKSGNIAKALSFTAKKDSIASRTNYILSNAFILRLIVTLYKKYKD